MKHAREGQVAFLTTRHPDHDSERDRIVFGVFEISKIVEDKDGISVIGNPETAIRLTKDAALSLPYWRFKSYPNGDQPAWGAGLFRYISNQEVSNFLHSLNPFLHIEKDRKACEKLLACCGSLPPKKSLENADVSLLPQTCKDIQLLIKCGSSRLFEENGVDIYAESWIDGVDTPARRHRNVPGAVI